MTCCREAADYDEQSKSVNRMKERDVWSKMMCRDNIVLYEHDGRVNCFQKG